MKARLSRVNPVTVVYWATSVHWGPTLQVYVMRVLDKMVRQKPTTHLHTPPSRWAKQRRNIQSLTLALQVWPIPTPHTHQSHNKARSNWNVYQERRAMPIRKRTQHQPHKALRQPSHVTPLPRKNVWGISPETSDLTTTRVISSTISLYACDWRMTYLNMCWFPLFK